jgi:hypothetical protein
MSKAPTLQATFKVPQQGDRPDVHQFTSPMISDSSQLIYSKPITQKE